MLHEEELAAQKTMQQENEENGKLAAIQIRAAALGKSTLHPLLSPWSKRRGGAMLRIILLLLHYLLGGCFVCGTNQNGSL